MRVHTGVAAWVALIAGGSVPGLFARGAGPLPGDLATTCLLQAVPPEGIAGLVLLEAGSAAWFLPVLALVATLLLRRWADAMFILLAVVGAVLIGDALKAIVGRPRPSPEFVVRYDVPHGYSYPSGTTLLTLVTVGVACYLIHCSRLPSSVATVVSFTLVLTVGLSRVYVGEHWASDVLGGWAFGGAWLLVLVALHRRWKARSAAARGAEAAAQR